MAFQSRDLLEAMQQDSGVKLSVLKVDGGACVNDELMQFQADMLGTQVQRPVVPETTALGAAYLAGLAVGYWDSLQEVQANWKLQQSFDPQMPESQRQRRYDQWADAVRRCQGWAKPQG